MTGMIMVAIPKHRDTGEAVDTQAARSRLRGQLSTLTTPLCATLFPGYTCGTLTGDRPACFTVLPWLIERLAMKTQGEWRNSSTYS